MDSVQIISKKIDVLKGLVQYLSNLDNKYHWYSHKLCNIGCLFRSLYIAEGYKDEGDQYENELSVKIERWIFADEHLMYFQYSDLLISNRFDMRGEVEICSVTGLPVNELSQKLIDNGNFTSYELASLELLSNPLYNEEGKLIYTCRTDVIKYVENWILHLEDQVKELTVLLQHNPLTYTVVKPSTKNTVPVSVSV